MTVTLLVSPEHVSVSHFAFARNLVQLATVLAQQTHPEGWLAQFHTLHETVHLVLLSGTYCLVQTRTKQGVHPITPAHWSNNNATLAQLNDEIVQSNRPFEGGRRWTTQFYNPGAKTIATKTN